MTTLRLFNLSAVFNNRYSAMVEPNYYECSEPPSGKEMLVHFNPEVTGDDYTLIFISG